MYEDSGCFDPNVMMVQGTAAAGTSEDCFSQIVSESDPPLDQAVITTPTTATETRNTFAENVGLSMEILSYPYDNIGNNGVASSAATATMEFISNPHQQMGFDMENPYNYSNNFTNTSHLVEEVNNNSNHGSSQDLSFDQSNLDTCVPELQRIYNSSHYHQNHQDRQFPYPTPTPDLLNLLHLPWSPASSLANSSISFENPAHNTNFPFVSYDPFLHLNLPAPPQAPHRELYQSLPHGYSTVPASRNDFVFGVGGDEIEGSGVAYQDGGGREFDNGVIEFTQDVGYVGKKRGRKRTKQFTCTTERQRRVDLGSKFEALKDLIPNPSKNDRASVVGDAVNYIRELLRTVNELKLLVEKKRYEKQRIKRHKVEEAATELGDLGQVAIGDPDNNHPYNESLRSSWIQRKSKDTEIDVRIIDNEVTIKLVQRKKINCLVYASQVLDELKLDLQHVAGGHIGDFCSFMFNTKICEGSSVYASSIANKLIEVMDRSFAAA